MNLFTIVFDDNTTFLGGSSFFETKWTEIPQDKKIRSIFYNIPFGDVLCLSGYDKYYHMIEGTNDLNGQKRGQLIIHSVRLMAKKDKAIKIWKFNFLNKDKIIEIEIKDENDKFIRSLNPIFWRG